MIEATAPTEREIARRAELFAQLTGEQQALVVEAARVTMEKINALRAPRLREINNRIASEPNAHVLTHYDYKEFSLLPPDPYYRTTHLEREISFAHDMVGASEDTTARLQRIIREYNEKAVLDHLPGVNGAVRS